VYVRIRKEEKESFLLHLAQPAAAEGGRARDKSAHMHHITQLERAMQQKYALLSTTPYIVLGVAYVDGLFSCT
jgi:hypothetical protein